MRKRRGGCGGGGVGRWGTVSHLLKPFDYQLMSESHEAQCAISKRHHRFRQIRC